ncbi:MAG: portal protein [Burkholderiaceae bacterium]
MAADIAQLEKQLSQLESLRLPHEQLWRECFDYSLPVRGDGFMGEQAFDGNGMLIKRARLLDGTASDGVEVQAAGIQGGTTPASALWFELDVEGASDGDKQWLEQAATKLHGEMHASNYDSARYECLLDNEGAGWFVMYVDVDRDQGGYMFEQWPLAECYIAASWPGGPVNRIMRKWKVTADQAVSMYGNAVSAKTLELSRSKPHEMVELIRAIYPRKTMGKYDLAIRMPYASCTFERAQKHVISESGYMEFPCIVPRWRLLPGSAYGIGPMYNALPDCRELNELMLGEKQALQMSILPPMKATDDGVFNPGSLRRLQSGKLYAVADMDNLAPITTNARPEVAHEKALRMQAAIRRTLMADILNWDRSGPQMTAAEVHARVAQLRQLLGPQYGRIQAEELAPTVERCFALGYRAGLFGQAPDSLSGRNFKVRYKSPFARAQRLEDVIAMSEYEQDLGLQAQAGMTEALDVYNWDMARRRKAELKGVPRDLLRNPEEIEAIREGREQATEQAKQQLAQQQASETMMDAAAQRYAKA